VPRPETKEGQAALWHGTQYPDQVFGLHEFQQHGHSVEFAGRERLDGIDYYVLKLTLSDGFVTWRYVNASTWRIERGRDVRALHPDLDAKEKVLENRWSDWRRVDGVLRSFRSEQVDVATGKVLQTTTVSRFSINPDLGP